MNERINEWKNERIKEWKNKWMYETLKTSECSNENNEWITKPITKVLKTKWIMEWINEWMTKWMNFSILLLKYWK